MATLLDRRLPRVDFRAPIWMTLPTGEERIQAQALNLSEKGLFIGTDASCDIGVTLRLSLPLGSEELDLEGRVAWARRISRAGAPAGIGIEFTNLDHDRLEQVKVAVGSDLEHGIRVRFSGLPAPIRARASVDGEVLSLHTELPFLKLGSVADFSLEGDATSHRGRIGRVSIEPGSSTDVPRLRIEVDVLGIGEADTDSTIDEADDPEGPQELVESAEQSGAIVVPSAAPQWIEPSLEVSTERIAIHHKWAAAGITGGAAVIGFAATFALLGTSSRPLPAPAQVVISADAPSATLADRPSTAMEAPALAPPATPAAGAATPVPGPASSDAAHSLSVRSTETDTTVSMRLAAGTTDGLRHYLLADPAGVAINLPSAELEAERKVHWLDRGPVKKVWIRDYDGGAQVRIFFPDRTARDYRVATNDGLVTVSIAD